MCRDVPRQQVLLGLVYSERMQLFTFPLEGTAWCVHLDLLRVCVCERSVCVDGRAVPNNFFFILVDGELSVLSTKRLVNILKSVFLNIYLTHPMFL